MIQNKTSLAIDQLITRSKHILIIQAENPDGDSLGSVLGLEQILGDKNKEISLYCAIDIPEYLRYFEGWSRVEKDVISDFDLSIIVDTSSIALLQKTNHNLLKAINNKPLIIIDHHQNKPDIEAKETILAIDPSAAATTQIIYEIANYLKYPINKEAAHVLAFGILSDTLGLTTPSTTSSTIRTLASLVDLGANLTKLDSDRKLSYQKSLKLLKYKGDLLKRIETYLEDQIAIITIPWSEIKEYSPIYNPPMLIMEDMRLIINNKVSIAFKVYDDQKITAKIRSNPNFPYADQLATEFGGGGHKFASGFKTTQYKDLEQLKSLVISKTQALLNKPPVDENI